MLKIHKTFTVDTQEAILENTDATYGLIIIIDVIETILLYPCYYLVSLWVVYHRPSE